MNKLLAATVAAFIAAPAFAAAVRSPLVSPDGRIVVSFDQNGEQQLTYSIERNGEKVIVPSALRVLLAEGNLSAVEIQQTNLRSVQKVRKLTATKAAEAKDNFNELLITVRPLERTLRAYQWIFRAYDDGVAFRYVVPKDAGLTTLAVRNEESQFMFGGDYRCHGFAVWRMDTSHEGEFDPVQAKYIREHTNYDLPLVCRTGKNAFAIAEANLADYGGMYLAGQGSGNPGVISRVAPRHEEKTLIARAAIGTEGAGSPWRVVMLGDQLGNLIDSNLIGNLNPDPSFDTSWIKAGKTAWDWWSGPYLPPPDKGGTDMKTIQRYMDFAGQSGFEYMMIDEGWSLNSGGPGHARPDADVTKTAPGIDMPALVAYGAKRKVGIWLWLQWSLLDRQMDEALALYSKWGIKGIKVDFMDRSDQQIVDYYHKLMKKAAEHKLMVDMHGAYPPAGLNRTWPNFLTQEGIMGAEYNKWSRRVTATHNVSLAYTRMLLGPLDYTPGGFRNRTPDKFEVVNSPPQVQTTRGHGLAMFVVYESPFQMVADSPDAYENAAGFDFVKMVPTTWDETRFLQGDIDEYVVVARRKGADWYVGAMGTESMRTIELPLSFLGAGKYKAKLWTDGAAPTDVDVSEREVGAGDTLTLMLAPSGGAAVKLAASKR